MVLCVYGTFDICSMLLNHVRLILEIVGFFLFIYSCISPFIDYRQVMRKEKVEAAQLMQMSCDMVSLCWWIH